MFTMKVIEFLVNPTITTQLSDFETMKNFTKETDAPIVIDDLLRQAGWDPADK